MDRPKPPMSPQLARRSSSSSIPHVAHTPPPITITRAPNRGSAGSLGMGSPSSPIDLSRLSPTARKMSMSSTPQQQARNEGAVGRLAQHPQLILGGMISTVVLSGIIYSILFSTSLDTSLPTSHILLERSTYLARKSNVLNQLFVKKSWAWTSFTYILHLASSPPSRTPRWTRLSAFILASTCWLIFTTWFFGAGLGDRIIALSGGNCAVVIPPEWGLDLASLQQSNSHLLPSGLSLSSTPPNVLPLPETFCSLRLPLTAQTHPDLFALLPSTLTSGSKLKHPIPRWHRGFDISGHVFLLTLSTFLLVRELIPSWRILFRTGQVGSTVGRGGAVHTLATVLGTSLVGLWIVMLGTTAVYFHNPPEKLSGLALGLATSALLNILTPETSSPSPISSASSLSSSMPSSTSIMSDGMVGEDENAARRGMVDDSAIVGTGESGDEYHAKME